MSGKLSEKTLDEIRAFPCSLGAANMLLDHVEALKIEMAAVEAERDAARKHVLVSNRASAGAIRALRERAERAKAELREMRAALERINVEHVDYPTTGGSYAIGVTDGHRCAANIARAALAREANT